MVRESISKMKNGKAAKPPDVVPEMVKAAGRARVDILTDLVNHIIVEGAILDEWELSTIVNCYMRKGDSLGKGNYRGLKLTDQILKIAGRITGKLTSQQVDIDEMQFDFMPGCGATNAIFILKQLKEKYLAKKKNLYFAFVNLEKAFDRVPLNVWWALRKLGVEE